MWILRVLLPEEECPLVYTGSDTASQVLFETYKSHWPDGLYTLESMLTGNYYIPHDGTGHPFWFTEDGLVHEFHNPKWLNLKNVMRDSFLRQIEIEGMSPGHSSRPEEPPDEEDDIL